MAGVKDAIVEILTDNAESREWATGGIFARRAPQLSTTTTPRLRNKYIVVRVVDSYLEETDSQNTPAAVSTDRIAVSVWATSSKDADVGANAVRHALDGMQAITEAGILIQRIRWLGTTDRESEDASSAEQLMDECLAEFTVAYDLP